MKNRTTAISQGKESPGRLQTPAQPTRQISQDVTGGDRGLDLEIPWADDLARAAADMVADQAVALMRLRAQGA